MKAQDALISLLLTLNLAATLALGAHWLCWPQRPLWTASDATNAVTSVELNQVLGHLRLADAVFLDPRPVSEYRRHLPTAFSFPPDATPTAYLTEQLSFAKPVVVICGDVSCDSAFELARRLAAEGHKELSVFPGGTQQWRSAGLPLQTSASK